MLSPMAGFGQEWIPVQWQIANVCCHNELFYLHLDYSFELPTFLEKYRQTHGDIAGRVIPLGLNGG